MYIVVSLLGYFGTVAILYPHTTFVQDLGIAVLWGIVGPVLEKLGR